MERALRLCVLGASYERSTSDFKDHDPTCDPARYLPGHHVERHAIHKATAVTQVRALAASGFDAFINLCDGAWDEDRAGVEVVQTLERLGQAFTGAGSAFYEPTREVMKVVCHYAGIDAPAFAFARAAAEAERVAASLRFPMIVKHPSSYGSVGMGRDARVETVAALHAQIERFVAAYGAALVEEFIEGREFTVLVTEPRDGEPGPWALLPMEARFPPGESFKHFALKWVDYEEMTWAPVHDEALSLRLRDVSARFFQAIGGSGYGRCDLRMDAQGRLFMLEINPNCGVFYPEGAFGSADLILANDPAGHRGFIEHLLRCALRRRERSRRTTEVRHAPGLGLGLYAARTIEPGEVIEAGETRPLHLVTRAHVERSWGPVERRWFRQYAWPITDEVHAMWSDRPEDWRPIDHSCDPSAWLRGLDLVARRAIDAGEAITMDYATFCGPEIEAFACRCGAASCRRTVRGEDHRASFVTERYGGHVSDYVRRAQAAQAHGLSPVVRGDLGQRSLVTRVAREGGELLATFENSARVDQRTRLTIEAGDGAHLELWPETLRLVNHACEPNAFFDVDARRLIALRPLSAGEELTYFYPSTELDMAEPFDCRCGSSRCIGHIRGARQLPDAALAGRRLNRHVVAALTADGRLIE